MQRYTAYFEPRKLTIAPVEAAKIAEVLVGVGQRVKAGAPLLRLDGRVIEAQIAVEKAEASRLSAELEAARERLHIDGKSVQWQWVLEAGRSRTGMANARSRLGAAEAEVKALDHDIEELRAVVGLGLSTGAELRRLEGRKRALSGSTEGLRNAVAAYRTNEKLAFQPAGIGQLRAETQLMPLSRALQVSAERLQALRGAHQALTLRAPESAVVTALFLGAGAVASGTRPALELTALEPQRLVLCVPEADQAPAVDTSLTLRSVTGSAQQLRARVSHVPAIVQAIPDACTQNGVAALMGQRGRVVQARVFGEERGEPGSVWVSIATQEFEKRWWTSWFGGLVVTEAHAGPSPQPVPRPMILPRALAKKTRFEPSGLVWHAGLSRYLVVSDDTGHEGASEHTPWLFLMDREGRVSPEPLSIEGADKLTDLEGIAKTPDGTVFVMSSQSHSRKGTRYGHRQKLLKLQRSDGQYKVKGQQRLAKALDESPELLESLGLQGTERLDLEGLTYFDGSLYIGVKAPLRDGAADIWRVRSPEALFAPSPLAVGTVERWKSLRLRASQPDHPPLGISELLFLNRDTLAIAATPSEGEPSDPLGSLWTLSLSEDSTGPRRVKEFPGLKPEGLARGPQGKRVTVLFDQGRRQPLWLPEWAP